MPSPVAILGGTDRQPEMRLFFDRRATHAATGVCLVEWVKKAPRRRWDSAAGCWVITAFGGNGTTPKDPERVLRKAGFEVVLDADDLDPSLANTISLLDVTEPICRQSQLKPGVALVRPRFAGWDVCRELLGAAASWDRDQQRFEVPLTELLIHGSPKPGLVIDKATVEAAQAALRRKPTFGSDKHDDETLARDAAAVAYSTGIDLTDADEAQVQRLVETVGDVPDWFGLDLYPYQRLGAVAACAGRGLICDDTGLGKTRSALAALAIRKSERAVIIVPPVVLTNWAREAEQSALGVIAPTRPARKTKTAPDNTTANTVSEIAPSGRTPPRHIVTFKAGRKEPDLPAAGVVIVADSLIASRPELRDRIARWNPDALVYDEAHRARNWRSARAEAIRDLCERLRPDAMRLPMTATPLFANPAELASLLAISGHLDPVFGGYTAFVERYCKRNHFKALVPRLNRLPELKRILAEQVWVRREKKDVLKDLPPKSRHAQYVDVDLAGFNRAHDEVIDKIGEWLDEFTDENGCYPDQDTIKEYSRQQIGLMSPLRKAAGLAKVPVVLDLITDWIADHVHINADGSSTCERPLLVWAHHHEVVDAIVEHAAKQLKGSAREMVNVIAGGTSQTQVRDRVDAFQAGRLPVLVCSITAAGVGITLTRGSDAIFCEPDWTPALISQAEDRQSRIGQTAPTVNTFLLGVGTLDEHIQRVLERKSRVISAVLGSEQGVHVVSDTDLDDLAGPTEVVQALVQVAIDRHQRARKNAA